ncbi:MAG: S46 family peptidase [Bacteroidaceae bacterium]|nr:S46 family peptidase [Bacteroidaceae bacterium]
MKVKILIIVAFATLFSLTTKADEGMWLLQLMQQQNSIDMMKKQGLKLDASAIYNPNGVSLKDAVGIFGGGCTGEIISPNGLVLTNHHCGYGAIQAHSSVEHDYLTDGFWAATLADELPNERLSFRFVHRIVDVTDLVNEQIKNGVVTEINSLTRPYLNKLAEEELAKSDLNGKPGIVAQAYPFYAGNKFYLIYYKVYTDVRMVAAPPSSIGKFGGETDNWMWPRHTCDFSVFRIYADKNGEPADYSPENVPLSTPKYLNISIKGLNEGDYAMILGFPGSTSRYLTESEVTERMYTTNQSRIDMRTVRLDVLREAMAKSDKTRIQYASKFAGSSNYWKNSIGMNQAIADNKVLEAKAEVEKQFKAFAQGKPEYEGVVDKINEIVEKSIPVERQIDYLSEFYSAIEFRTPAEPMNKMKEALNNKDNAAINEAKEMIRTQYARIHNKDYDHEVDRLVAKAMIPALQKALSSNELPNFYQTIQRDFKGNVDAFVDNIYNNSILANEANLEKFLKKPTVKAIDKDPSYAFTSSTMNCISQAMDVYGEIDDLSLLHKAFIRGLGEMKQPTPSYPDANFTMRLTYGNVKSYDPKDGVHYKYYTTGDGVLQKENPDDPEFVVPAKLKELLQKRDFGRYAMKDGSLPACFLTTNDITGGNSGSPVMNDNGELIGIAFDGNWESLSGDINFDDNLQRCIAVDIRYVLFVIDKLGGAQRLINEMTINEN